MIIPCYTFSGNRYCCSWHWGMGIWFNHGWRNDWNTKLILTQAQIRPSHKAGVSCCTCSYSNNILRRHNSLPGVVVPDYSTFHHRFANLILIPHASHITYLLQAGRGILNRTDSQMILWLMISVCNFALMEMLNMITLNLSFGQPCKELFHAWQDRFTLPNWGWWRSKVSLLGKIFWH